MLDMWWYSGVYTVVIIWCHWGATVVDLWSPCHCVINVGIVAVVVYTVGSGPREFGGGTAVLLCWPGVILC